MPKERLRSIIDKTAVRRSARSPIDVFAEGDSIDRLEAVLAVEAELQISLPEEELQNLRSLEDLDLMVERIIATGPPALKDPITTPEPPAIPPAEVPIARWGHRPPARWLR